MIVTEYFGIGHSRALPWQRRDEVLLDIDDVAAGHVSKMRWNPRDQWIWSAEQTHPALVSRETFDQVQARSAAHTQPDAYADAGLRAAQRTLDELRAASASRRWGSAACTGRPTRIVLITGEPGSLLYVSEGRHVRYPHASSWLDRSS
ncbi:MAG TPA: hypothetical protein VFA45_12590 [Actinomycetes bacterium]|nr:hypothetical protein [Actinomycetes bacterium]